VIFWSFQKAIAAADRRPSALDPEAVAVEFDLPPKPTEMEAVPERKRIGALLVIYAIVIVFWMVFHQNGTTMTYWANDNTDWASSKVVTTVIYILTLGFVQGDKISGVVSNSINPFWIVVLSYPLTRVWAWLRSIGREPSTPTKMAFGMLLTCLAFLILYFAAKSGGDQSFVMDSSGRHALDEKGEYAAIQHRVSPYWLVSAFFVISLGELMLSPMGLSLVSKVAPARMRGMMMGGWFVATAIGNKLTAIGLLWTKWYHSSFWLLCSCSALFMAIVLLLLLRPLKKAMPGA
jgi:POT family proton-dependent oligopeptide transporter